MRKILIATHNPGKILEYREIFNGHQFELLMLNDLNISEEPEEDGKTFEENAIKKVEFYSQFSDLPIIAEDSGLEIDYLNGEPGVYSRRWPGHKATDQELIQMALEKLEGVPRDERGAQFRVVIAFKASPDSRVITSEGISRGYITEKSSVKVIPGFPFRSIFYLPEIGKVLGESTMIEESKIAHRRKAMENLWDKLDYLK